MTATICPINPPGHDWQNGLSCRWCTETRTPEDAILSGLASRRGGTREAARALLDAYTAEVAAELTAVRAELAARTEHIAFLDRNTLPELHRTIQHHIDGKQRWRGRAERAEAERDALKKRLHDAAMTRTWRNEDGKKFVFVEDIAPILLGVEPRAEAAS